jgi:hypothetical protein
MFLLAVTCIQLIYIESYSLLCMCWILYLACVGFYILHVFVCVVHPTIAYLCFNCASPGSTASTHSYKMKYQEYKGLYYNV